MACGRQFRGKVYLGWQTLWHDYLEGKQTMNELAAANGVSRSTVKRILSKVAITWRNPVCRGHGVIQLDATYFGRNCGVLVALEATSRRPLYLKHIAHERTSDYAEALAWIERDGYVVDGIVIDGMQTLFSLFKDYKVQMCQYHMCAIVRRKLTGNPRLPAGRELKTLMTTLTTCDRDTFYAAFEAWVLKWDAFLKERTVNPETGHTFYTHRRLRSAMVGIRFYLPYLFTWQQVEGMPNTNNRLEGIFTDLKRNINNHSGMSRKNRERLINGFFLALGNNQQ
jgi:hypothetical protein